ncbi:MAG: hypothetical protein ACT4QE_06195, partial [Anaerolineales bacterium]
MLSSLAQLQKYLSAEISLKYSNKAVIGGLPKMLTFWEPNAKRDGLDADAIDGIVARINGYPDLPQEKRAGAVAELLNLIRETNTREMAKRQPATAATPKPSAPASLTQPKPESRTAPPPVGADSKSATPAPRPQPSQPKPRPAPAQSQPPAFTQEVAKVGTGAGAGTRPAPTPAPTAAPTQAQTSTPTPTQAEGDGKHHQRPERSSFNVEPLDPRPRRAGPKPLKAQDPVDPLAGLDAPLTVLRGVGPETATDYERLGLHTLRDLLLYFPRRYDNYSKMKTINRLEYGEECTLIATVWEVRERKFRANRTMLKIVLADGTGMI